MTAPARSALLALLPRGLAAALAAALLATGLSAPASATPDETPAPPEATNEPTSAEPTDSGEVPTDTSDDVGPADPAETTETTGPAEEPSTDVPVYEGGEGVGLDTAPEPADDQTADLSTASTARTTVMSARPFALPLPSGSYRMTSPQGPRCAPTINASLAHMGQDMAAPYGTPIYAIAAGTVRWARPEPAAGQWIVIEHVVNGQLFTSSYSHSRNATEFVQAGDRVKAGQRIGTVASTGVSTGNHLHLEIWEGKYGTSGGGKVVNPDSWLAARGVSLRAGATSVYLPPTPKSCTYWAVGTTRLYASPSSSAPIVATVLGGAQFITSGVGTKTNSFIRVKTSVGTIGWAPASQVSPKRISPTAPLGGVLDRDFNGDGFSDIVAIDSRGRFTIRMGNGADGWIRTRVGSSGWSGSRLIAANDANRDGHADLYRINADGRIYFYPGRGDGTFRPRIYVGSGWRDKVHAFSPGDFNGDGKVDLLAVDRAGVLWLYRGNGKGGIQTGRVRVASGFGGYAQVTAGGDVNRDGKPDLLTVDRNGRLVAHLGNRAGRITGTRVLGTGWSSLRVQPLGMFNADRVDDYLAIASDGRILLYRGSATSSWVQPRLQIGSGWTGYRLG